MEKRELRSSSYARQDYKERSFPTHEVLSVWDAEYSRVVESLHGSQTVDDFVDVVRTCSLRAGTANRNNLLEWRDRWYELKYFGLIGSAIKRQEGLQGIRISVDYDNRDEEPLLVFVFRTKPKAYRTVTSQKNIEKLVGADHFQEIFHPLDF